MEQLYDILMGDKTVGSASVHQEGLYYRIRCRCSISGDALWRVLVCSGNREESLGILVPVGDDFCLDTRIQMKKIGEGMRSFCVVPRYPKTDGIFVPLSPEEPFRYITRLKDAFLEKRNGKLGIVMKEPGCE